MRWFLLLLGLYLAATSAGRAQSFTWANKNTASWSHKVQVSTDAGGNTFVVTAFTGTQTVGPHTFTSRGGTDVLLIKYNAAGKVEWARRIGGKADEQVGDVAKSLVYGYVYVTGSFSGTAQFDGYHGIVGATHTSAGGSDAFVACYTSDTGVFKWAKRAGGPLNDKGNGVCVDASGYAYATGSFAGKASFQTEVTPYEHTSQGLTDIFLVKYDPGNGSVNFAKRFGGTGSDEGRAVVADPYEDKLYLTGGSAPASHPYIFNVFTAMLRTSGGVEWSHTAGSNTTVDVGNDIAITKAGPCVIGEFGGGISFGTHLLLAGGGSDAFVVQYPPTKDGKAMWAKRFGGPGWDEGQAIATQSGRIYIAGTFTGTATFGHHTVTPLGGATDRDLYLTEIHADGIPSWTQRIGSTSYDHGRGGLAAPPYQAVYLAGNYGGNSITLGSKTLNGAGNLLTLVEPPEHPKMAGLYFINADTDTKLIEIEDNPEINYMTLGTNQINISQGTYMQPVGSIKFELNGVTKIENQAPYTWAGDAPKDGGTDYLGFTPSVGSHKLTVAAYSGPNGTGVRSYTKTCFFTVVNQPVLSSLTLINAVTDKAAGSLTAGQTINYSILGTSQINLRANTNPGKVGSVKFNLDGVIKIENQAPYTYAGDSPKDGGTNYHPFTLSTGTHKLVVTPYAGPNATGTPGKAYEVSFQVVQGGFVQHGAGRLETGKPAPETDGASLAAAPNPFAGRTTLTFTAPEDGPARLEVYGPAGTRTSLLFEGPVEAGKTYQYAFDGTALPPGLYVGRLTTGRRVTHRKLLLGR